MNAVIHSEISSKRWKAPAEDFLAIHDFLDSTKELESSNLHRAMLLHSIFGIKQVVIPIFGHTLVCSNGVKVNIKDCLESDHLAADFRGRFIPSFSDYVDLCSDSPADKDLIESFLNDNKQFFENYPQVKETILSPLWNTGKLKSLLLTMNSWFIGKILPLIYKDIKVELKDYNISPSMFFNRCRYESWLSNGDGPDIPLSFKKIEEKRKKVTLKKIEDLSDKNELGKIVYDRSIFPLNLPVEFKPEPRAIPRMPETID